MEEYPVAHKLVNRIAPPTGFERVQITANGQAAWLRNLPLYPGKPELLLYNNEAKWNQNAHFAVINMDVGKEDLQQCADAVMRLKAEYHYSKQEYDQIHFNFTSGDFVGFDDWRKGKKPRVSGNRVNFTAPTGQTDNSYTNFKKYLREIFMYAGTASLEKELQSVTVSDIQAGDVFIQGGFPGHAILVLDVAKHPETGKTAVLFGQSYMPAQQFHVLNNLEDSTHHPWYILEDLQVLNTPEWDFQLNDLMRFRE
ncbi:MAG: DUF4846 domain-containing protein [Bacteroidota bacterium]